VSNHIQNSYTEQLFVIFLKIKQSSYGKLLKEIRDQRGTT